VYLATNDSANYGKAAAPRKPASKGKPRRFPDAVPKVYTRRQLFASRSRENVVAIARHDTERPEYPPTDRIQKPRQAVSPLLVFVISAYLLARIVSMLILILARARISAAPPLVQIISASARISVAYIRSSPRLRKQNAAERGKAFVSTPRFSPVSSDYVWEGEEVERFSNNDAIAAPAFCNRLSAFTLYTSGRETRNARPRRSRNSQLACRIIAGPSPARAIFRNYRSPRGIVSRE